MKFEIHIFHKVVVHILYLISTFFLLNTIHLVLKESTLEVNPQWLGLINTRISKKSLINTTYVKRAMMIMAFMIPVLLLSFGLLYVYYNSFHPWVSEGISMGFEPKDNGLWRPFSASQISCQGKTSDLFTLLFQNESLEF